jgi:hypothetical protein
MSDLAPIGLDELNDRAALQTRIDRKYLLPMDEVRPLLAEIGPQARVLEIDGARLFAYESVYFDTPELTSYLAAAHRRRHRFKVRTRSYLDSQLCWLEVKTRGARGSTVKDRLPYQLDNHTTLAPGRDFVETILAEKATAPRDAASFTPTLTTRYRRSTLFLPATDSRVTIDTDLEWEDETHMMYLPGLAIIETKTGSTASCVDRLLWSHHRRPIRLSKYATCLAALRPDLPATRWRRTLSRHFTAVCPGSF